MVHLNPVQATHQAATPTESHVLWMGTADGKVMKGQNCTHTCTHTYIHTQTHIHTVFAAGLTFSRMFLFPYKNFWMWSVTVNISYTHTRKFILVPDFRSSGTRLQVKWYQTSGPSGTRLQVQVVPDFRSKWYQTSGPNGTRL